MDNNQIQGALASQLGKLLRDSFGKGPQSIYINIRRPYVVVYMRQFVAPMESILIEQGKQDIVEQTRALLLDSLAPEIMTSVRIIANLNVKEIYYDWNYHNRSGVIVMVEHIEDIPPEDLPDTDYSGKLELHEEIDTIGLLTEKRPERTSSCMMNPRTFVVVRDGILVPIEKELISQGFEQVLKVAKRILEKRYLHNRAHIEPILGMKVIDIFVDWNFSLDKSVIVIVTQPKEL